MRQHDEPTARLIERTLVTASNAFRQVCLGLALRRARNGGVDVLRALDARPRRS